jgi:hypothetical protein
MDSAAKTEKCGGRVEQHGEQHERLSDDLDYVVDLEPDSKPEVTLFVAGKMYMGREMRYLGKG